jgi:hypothetical protein
MITNIEEAKIVWRGMVATYKRMGDHTFKLIYRANAETGDILEARGLYLQAGKIMDRMAKQLDLEFPDYVFDMHGKFVRTKK